MPTTIAHRTAVALTGADVAIALLSLVLAAVLSFTYVPTGAQAWDDPSLGGGTGWTAWHQWSVVVWAIASVAVVAITAARSPFRAASTIGAAIVPLVAAVIALSTRSLVQWDQLALWAVTVGSDLDGYWAALDDGVRFVLIDGVELERSAYGVALALHLLAHLVGVAGAVGTLVLLLRKHPDVPEVDAALAR